METIARLILKLLAEKSLVGKVVPISPESFLFTVSEENKNQGPDIYFLKLVSTDDEYLLTVFDNQGSAELRTDNWPRIEQGIKEFVIEIFLWWRGIPSSENFLSHSCLNSLYRSGWYDNAVSSNCHRINMLTAHLVAGVPLNSNFEWLDKVRYKLFPLDAYFDVMAWNEKSQTDGRVGLLVFLNSGKYLRAGEKELRDVRCEGRLPFMYVFSKAVDTYPYRVVHSNGTDENEYVPFDGTAWGLFAKSVFLYIKKRDGFFSERKFGEMGFVSL